MPRAAVIALIHENHAAAVSQLFANGSKVVRHAEQAMQHDEGIALTVALEKQFHQLSPYRRRHIVPRILTGVTMHAPFTTTQEYSMSNHCRHTTRPFSCVRIAIGLLRARGVRLGITSLLAVLLLACSSMEYNPTVIKYSINEAVVKDSGFRQVMIAPINIGKPSRKYLDKGEKRVDRYVEEYLKQNGFEVVSNRPFESRWLQAQRKYGQVYDPSSGKFSRYYQSALAETLTQVFEGLPNLDAVIFTDLVEREIMFTDGMQHIARWDGVQRKPKYTGTGDSVPEDFSWQKNVDAVSLTINVFDRSLKNVFQSAGGLEVTQALNLRDAKFVRRNDVLENETNINEGIQLALHPMITMKNYPGKEP
jgi:hypothetical protein